MDQTLKTYLANHGIKYKTHSHQPIFTVAQSLESNAEIPGVFHTKNLFLKDEAGSFYLVCMYAHKKLNLKDLKNKLKAKKKIQFASQEELKAQLNVSPGSVSIFSAIYAKKITLVIDKKILEAEKTGFHPNDNTATLEINKENLLKFLQTLKIKTLYLEL